MSIQSTLDLFRASIVRIGGAEHRYFGTAAWVAPNILLTCKHVVEKVPPDSLAIYLRPFDRQDKPIIIPDHWIQQSPLADLALITFPKESPAGDHPCIYLDAREPEPAASLWSLGFTAYKNHGEELEGKYGGWANDDFNLNKFQHAQVVGGFSGSPLLLLGNFTVCGIIKETRHPGYDAGGHYIPVSEVWSAFPELRDLNLSFHLKDARWSNAAFTDRKPQSKPLVPHYPNNSLQNSFGKDHLLKDLISLIEEEYKGPVNLYAPASMGKAWLAGLYMSTRKWRYDLIAWFNLVSDYNSEIDFPIMLITTLDGTSRDKVESTEGLVNLARVKISQEIASTGPKLIIIRGVKSDQQILPYLKWLTAIHDARIIITSSVPIDSTTLFTLPEIEEEYLLQMFGSYLNSSGEEHIQNLLEYINKSPLIINLIRQNTPKENWAEADQYLSSLTEEIKALPPKEDLAELHSDIIAIIIELSALKLDEEWLLLQFCALPETGFKLHEVAQLVLCGHGENIPEIANDEGYENFEKDYHLPEQSPFQPRRLYKLLEFLSLKGWLTVEAGYYRLSSLIKEAIILYIPPQPAYLVSLTQTLYENYMGDDFGPVKGNTLYQQHLRSAIAVIPPSEEYFSLSLQLIRTLEDLHLEYLALPEQENYLGTLSAFEQQEGTYPSEKVLDALIKLITLHRDISGNYLRALEFSFTALDIARQLFGPDDNYFSVIYFYLSNVHELLGRYEEALEWIERGLSIEEGNPNVSDDRRANTYYEKGNILSNLGRYEVALEWIERCLTIQEGNLNVSDGSRANTYHLKVDILSNLGRYQDALEWIERRLTIEEGNPNVSDSSRANTYYLKGNILSNLGRYEEALEWIGRCMTIEEGNPNVSDDRRASNYYQKGNILSNLGRYEEALEWIDRCLTIREGNPNVSDGSRAITYYRKGEVLSNLGRYEEALEWIERCLTIQEGNPNVPEEDKGQTYLLLSLIHAHLKNESLTIEYYDRAVTILKDTPHPWIQEELQIVSDLINSK